MGLLQQQKLLHFSFWRKRRYCCHQAARQLSPPCAHPFRKGGSGGTDTHHTFAHLSFSLPRAGARPLLVCCRGRANIGALCKQPCKVMK